MIEEAFEQLDAALRSDPGITTAATALEQLSWLLFLRRRACSDGPFGPYGWQDLAARRGALTDDELLALVTNDLFPHLVRPLGKIPDGDLAAFNAADLFGGIACTFFDGGVLRRALGILDDIDLGDPGARAKAAACVEARIVRARGPGRYSAEVFTSRALIRAMVQVVNPAPGETVYDGAAGSAGFLTEALRHAHTQRTPGGQGGGTCRVRGHERHGARFAFGLVSLLLAGIDTPAFLRLNSLAVRPEAIPDDEKTDVILSHPPLGARERVGIANLYPVPTPESQLLFLQHYGAALKPGGRAAVVVNRNVLTDCHEAAIAVRRQLLQNCNLHTVLDCPYGPPHGFGVAMAVLFFGGGGPTRRIWLYKLGRPARKKKPVLDDPGLQRFVTLQAGFAESDSSWSIDAAALPPDTMAIPLEDPRKGKPAAHQSAAEILAEIEAAQARAAALIAQLRAEFP